MTDNTPRPEPMSRESVLAVLDNAAGICEENDLSDQGLRAVSAAVAALYESDIEIAYEMNAWKSRLNNQQRTIEQLQVKRDALKRAVNVAHCHAYGERMEGKFIRSNYHIIPSAEWKAIFAATTSTDPSDAEGGG